MCVFRSLRSTGEKRLPSSFPVLVELLTPAYAGGANSNSAEQLRPSALKGLLRFWWRTLHPEIAPADLFLLEEQLFGSTRTGQRLRFVPGASAPWESFEAGSPPGVWELPYLGYGVQERRPGQGVRHAKPGLHPDPAGSQFAAVDLRFVGPASAQDLEQLRGAIWLWSAFGGFGMRTRRGFGAVRVRSEFENLPAFAADTPRGAIDRLVDGLRSIVPHPLSAKEPEHSAFAHGARLLVRVPQGSDGFFEGPEYGLRATEKDLSDYRRSLGWTRNHQGTEGSDHRWRAREIARVQAAQGKGQTELDALPTPSSPPLPEAAALGLPLKGAMSSKWAADVDAQGIDGTQEIDHRASPILASVSGWGVRRFLPTILYLPGRFLPDDAELIVRVREPLPPRNNKPGDVKKEWPLGSVRPDAGAAARLLDWLVTRGWREVDWT